MLTIEESIAFVHNQMEFHSRQADRYQREPRRVDLHKETAEKFRELRVLLENVNTLNHIQPSLKAQRLDLAWDEIQDLPPELMAELSISDSDKLDFNIVKLIESVGGVATLDRILVSIYKLTGEILKRPTLNARLYRMGQKELIYSVPGKKGVYSTRPISEDEAIKLN